MKSLIYSILFINSFCFSQNYFFSIGDSSSVILNSPNETLKIDCRISKDNKRIKMEFISENTVFTDIILQTNTCVYACDTENNLKDTLFCNDSRISQVYMNQSGTGTNTKILFLDSVLIINNVVFKSIIGIERIFDGGEKNILYLSPNYGIIYYEEHEIDKVTVYRLTKVEK